MLKRTTIRRPPSFIIICLLAAVLAAPGLSNAQSKQKQETKEQRNKSEKKSKSKNDKNSDNTIWLEEKLNPSTQWLEKAVKPLTRWVEDQVQLKPKEHKPKLPKNKRRPQNQNSQPANNFTPNPSGALLEEADIRRLLKQRYSANILHIKALGQGQKKRYRVKLINQQGVIQILHLSAINGQEISR